MPTLSYGLNITKKAPSLASNPASARRKTIFDEDSGPEDGPDHVEDRSESVSTLGGLPNSSTASRTSIRPTSNTALASKLPKPSRISPFGDLSTNHTTSKHAQDAQSLDPSIYDYDAVYDSLHSKPKVYDRSAAAADEAKKPKYMENLLAAAETRKRDQLRAKEKMLAKERELEGEEFADKEKFVTAAYKRQQEEVRKAEADEALREREAAERQRREGGGLKGMYKNMLERGEEKHASAVMAVEEAKKKGTLGREEVGRKGKGMKEKSEAEIAREKGAVVNEEGQVVDKRQLLNAGLNAGTAAKAKAFPPGSDSRGSGTARGKQVGSRDSETRAFEDRVLGKRGPNSEEKDGTNGRASKSRKMEEEILASLGL
ncbi:MAG: hypothetical protein LQ346_000542 [Caloplaca aetnensis]|nr:MAG: hypothetical protein LQ346_000542 [Caloplaca aetnensis]